MKQVLPLAILLSGLLVACAGSPVRYPGYYDRTDHVYSNEVVGFYLTIPHHWAVMTKHRDFTVPVNLRPDQEQVLEAYDAAAKLGLVIVVQQGPLAEIAELVRRMQAVSEDQLARRLQSPNVMDVRQTAIRETVVNGHAAVEWIYTAMDITAGQSVDVTVISYIFKVGERYVYLTFSVPAAQSATAQSTIWSILNTFTPDYS